MKTFGTLTIQTTLAQSTHSLVSPSTQVLGFFDTLYTHLYNALIQPQSSIKPHIDGDAIKIFIAGLLTVLNANEVAELRRIGVAGNPVSTTEWNSAKESKALMIFLSQCPFFTDFLLNIHPLSSIVIKSYELIHNAPVNTQNFIHAKQWIDSINRIRWNRQPTPNERQSGVSILGSVSELLLEKAFSTKLNGVDFFKTSNQKIQSYGDFVLMCLPNNLWLSVKSNFARERLLASGYTTDIIGVGFFTDKDEFTSKSKIRNLQRVGFLAMYLPNIPISDEQVQSNTNTYEDVTNFYLNAGRPLPLNINGSLFIRSLADIESDMGKLLAVQSIANRTTLDF